MIYFKNLAGENVSEPERSQIVQTELLLAGLTPIRNFDKTREVRTDWCAELNGWKFHRAWRYWTVKNEISGFTLEQATELAKKGMPTGYNCGETVRINGGGEVYPTIESLRIPAKFNKEIVEKYLDYISLSKEKMKEMDNELENYPNKFVCTYHVDDLLGLKMLVDKIKEVVTEKNTEKFQLAYPNKIFNNGDINWVKGVLQPTKFNFPDKMFLFTDCRENICEYKRQDWNDEFYRTGCGVSIESSLRDNDGYKDYKICPFCGKQLKIIRVNNE